MRRGVQSDLFGALPKREALGSPLSRSERAVAPTRERPKIARRSQAMQTARDKPNQSRAEQIFARFKVFHQANPIIWDLFKRYVNELISNGRAHYSVDAVMHRIRWHVDVETKGESVKLNDHYTAYYGRMFMAKYPEHEGFFELRKRLSAEHDAYDQDVAVFRTGPAGPESSLMNALRGL